MRRIPQTRQQHSPYLTGIEAGLIASLSVLLVGCCTHRRGYETPTASRLLQAATRGETPVTSLRARAKVDQFTRKGRVKVRVFLLAAAGGRLRFEAVSPFDTTLLTLTSDGKRFVSLDHRAQRVLTGPAKACAVARVFGLALKPDQVLEVLTGQIPLISFTTRQVRWDRCKGLERLVLTAADGRVQQVWLRHVGSRFRSERSEVRDARGKLLLSIRFERFRRVGRREVPGRIRFVRPATRADVIIRYDKLSLNVPIPAEAFSLRVPPGLPEGTLDCQ